MTILAAPTVEKIGEMPPHTLESKDYDALRRFFDGMERTGVFEEKGLTVSDVDALIGANEAMVAAENLRQWLLWFGPPNEIVPELRVSVMIGHDFIRISRKMLDDMRGVLRLGAKFLEPHA